MINQSYDSKKSYSLQKENKQKNQLRKDNEELGASATVQGCSFLS